MARARRGDPVDGVLLLDKPSGITSNFALQKARRLLNAAKAGHTGTLDPLASGLLPLTFGEATKFSADLLEADKAYLTTIQLGVRTATADADGEVVERRPVAVTRPQLEAALSRFVGIILQVPPMHSALKREGRALYEYARAGIELEREARQVRIDRLALRAFDGERAEIEVECGKGTYVRVLADDLGKVLGCGAHVAALRRTRVGRLTLEGSVTLAQLEALAPEMWRARLLPVDTLIAEVPRVDLGAEQARRFIHGNALDLGGTPGRRRVYGPDQQLLGVAELDQHGVLNARRLIATDHPTKALS